MPSIILPGPSANCPISAVSFLDNPAKTNKSVGRHWRTCLKTNCPIFPTRTLRIRTNVSKRCRMSIRITLRINSIWQLMYDMSFLFLTIKNGKNFLCYIVNYSFTIVSCDTFFCQIHISTLFMSLLSTLKMQIIKHALPNANK